MKECGVYVRAKSPTGKWWSAPIEALTEDSWRAWVCFTMQRTKSLAEAMAGMPELETTIEPPAESPPA